MELTLQLFTETPEGFIPLAAAVYVHPDGSETPLMALTLWATEDLKRIGVFRPEAAVPVPEGYQIVSTKVDRVKGVVRFVNEIALVIQAPLTATRRQFMLALYSAGLLDAAEAIAMNHPYRPVQLEWQNATSFEEDSPTLQALLIELDKTDADLHELMIAANKL